MDFLDDRWEFKIDLDYRDAPEDEKVVQQNRKTLMDAFDRMVAGDAESFWAIFDPEAVFHEASALPYGGSHKGIPAIQKAVATIASQYSKMHTRFETISASRDSVFAYQTITFKVKKNGNTGSLPVAELYRFRNGKVIEWRALYFDPSVVAKAIAG
jgi:ketosteroid isomerase-like protein